MPFASTTCFIINLIISFFYFLFVAGVGVGGGGPLILAMCLLMFQLSSLSRRQGLFGPVLTCIHGISVLDLLVACNSAFNAFPVPVFLNIERSFTK